MHNDRMGMTDEVTYKLLSGDEAVKSKEPYVPKKTRPDRLIRARFVLREKINLRGTVTAILRGPDGIIKQVETGHNLITDHGDEHAARRLFDDAIDIVTGMRLGTSTTAVAKAGAGGALVAYISGSEEALDATAGNSDLGAGLGHRATYVSTWVAADVVNSNINETVLTDETPITDTAGVLGDTVARFVFGSTIDKQVGDSLEVTWNNDALGA